MDSVDLYSRSKTGRLSRALGMLALAASAVLVRADYVPSGPPMATGKTQFLGSCYSGPQVTSFAAYFNQVTPENAGKWGSVEAVRDVMNWTELDNAYNFAKSNGFKFRFHILVWGSQAPSWISNLPVNEKRAEIEEWFAAVAARYPDLDYVEVVNEPLHAPPNGKTIAFSTTLAANYADALGGDGTTGWDWILESFRLARKYFPGKDLVLNEYGILNDGGLTARYVQIINLLKAEDLVDIVATQAHAFETFGVSSTTISNNLATLAATGLPVMITEMDIDGQTDQVQLDEYKRVFPILWNHPSVIGITLWGFRPGLWRNAQGAYLVQADGTERPAMVWLKAYVSNKAPVITANQSFPVKVTTANNTVVGTVAVTDTDAGTTLQNYQITGGTGADYFTINAATGQITLTNRSGLQFSNGNSYTLLVRVNDGIVTGPSGTVTISIQIDAPSVTVQPYDRLTTINGNTTFSVTSLTPLADTYQWQISTNGGTSWSNLIDGTNYAGTSSSTLTVKAATLDLTGYKFRCTVTNPAGNTTSNAATLTVTTAIPSRFYALATRAVVGAGTDVLIPGLAITGNSPKKIIIRALGPELGKRNVSGFLADPTLNLLTLAGQSLATSDDWDHTNPEYRAAFTQVGLTDLPDGSKDAVLIATLPPGLYTPVIAGKNGGTGVALVEFYDLDPSNGTLAAISTRAMVGTGADVLIPGIVIDGSTTKNLLVRVAGPELLKRNVGNALLDPTFELKDINGTTLLTNDNWDNNDAALIAATNAVGAPQFSAGSKDAAILAHLQPGIYTIVIKGVNNTSGVALVELFDVP